MANGKPPWSNLFPEGEAVCASPEETLTLGLALGARLSAGAVVSLEGPLGAGKTQLTKGIVRALGPTSEASSPSFALVHEYVTPAQRLYHFDFYRMESAGELINVGYDDCLADGITVIEWGDKFPEMLPAGTLRLELEILPDDRRRIRARTTP